MNRAYYLLVMMISFIACQSPKVQEDSSKEWRYYLGDNQRSHYSELTQINPENVAQLQVVWEYDNGEASSSTRIQCSPLMVDGLLYGVTANLKVFAVDAATGKEVWKIDPFESGDVSRGLIYWEDGNDQRILVGGGRHIVAVDAKTGAYKTEFGEKGKLDLKQGLDRDVEHIDLRASTPGVVYKGLLIQGFSTSESLPSIPGHIRAFDIRTGKQIWIFHTIPYPGEEGYETWPEQSYLYAGGANSWSGMSLDEDRGMVFVPTGSAAFDFWGGDRKGKNLFANSIIALNAETGERIWHFQTVHHDIWDRDLPAPPNLLSITHNGHKREVVAQITKSGHVFVLDRETGEPIFPIEEQTFPASDLYREESWPTQPIPTKPPAFSRQTFTEADINPHSPDKDSLVAVIRSVFSGGPFYPPSLAGSMIYPGFDGGAEWGGAAHDPHTGMLYVNANEMPWILTMVDIRAEVGAQNLGKRVYQNYCMGCHGADLQGSNFHGTAPALLDLKARLQMDSVKHLLQNGRGAMPAFSFLPEAEINAVSAFLLEESQQAAQVAQLSGAALSPYSHTGYNRFLDSEGYPAVKPPWGTLSAIDLNKGEIAWQVPLGTFPELAERGLTNTGTENYGGPILTASGLIFIGATMDNKFRAFDKNTGEELWSYQLPVAAMATPCTYELEGRQYVVVAVGGGKMTKERADKYVAFSFSN